MVGHGLIEIMAERLGNLSLSDDCTIWKYLLKEPAHQERAFSLGIVSTALTVLNYEIWKQGEVIRVVSYLTTLLACPLCHKEFVDHGGVKLFLSVIAGRKDSIMFASLYTIASNNDDLVRVIASEPALSAQMGIVFKKGPDDCKQHCIHLVSLFAGAGITIHPSVIAVVVPSLLDIISLPETAIPQLIVIRALVSLCANDECAKLVAANGGTDTVARFLRRAKSEERHSAIRLQPLITAIEINRASLPTLCLLIQ